jgi:alpha-tubulin suppressor-like RCC1 family protein
MAACNNSAEPPPPPVPLFLESITAGNYATCGIGLDNTAYCWGEGRYGQLGFPGSEDCTSIPGESPCATAPGRVSGTHSFISISAGAQHACGITTTGQTFCWGDDQFGQLGTSQSDTCGRPPTPCARAPVIVQQAGLSQLSSGGSHTCAVRQNGVGYCWGYGAYGRLGNGSSTNIAVPDSVRGLLFRSIVAASSFSCGIAADSTVYCWGYNHLGQLGNGTTTTSLLPTPITGNRHFVQLTAGIAHACAITSQGEAYCWGSATEGELGSTAATELCEGYACNKTPVLVAGSISFVSVTAGLAITCGRSAGASYCWGAIPGVVEFGRGLGLKTPVAFGTRGTEGGDPFVTLSAAYDHACGITAEHKAYCWGSDYHGKLGNGPDSAGVAPAPVLVVLPDSSVAVSR